MLTSLAVSNFKSLADMSLSLNKFNVLVGPNNSGKSNVIDAVMRLLNPYKKMAYDGFYLPTSYSPEEYRRLHFYGTPLDSPIEFYARFIEEGKEWSYQFTVGMGTGKLRAEQLKKPSWVDHPWRLFHFSPAQIRYPQVISNLVPLTEDGRNLSSVLLAMWNSRHKSFVEIEEHLKAAIDDVDHITTPILSQNSTQLGIKEKYFDNTFDANQLSDGTLSLLAHLVAIYGPERPSLICFEESENFVHPHIIEHLIDMMKKAEAQVIISTHSPTFLNYVEPEDLIIVSKTEGKTKCERLQKPEKFKDQPLGDLWLTGELGGVP